MPPMRDQIAQQAYELSELRTQRQELRRLNGLLEKDCARLTEDLSASQRENERLTRQVAYSNQETRLVREEARNAKQQAQYAKDSAQKARAELEKVKQAKADSGAEEWAKKYQDLMKLAKLERAAAEGARAGRDQALADLEASEKEADDLFSQLQAAQTEASEGRLEAEKYQRLNCELETRLKELETKAAPLQDSIINVSKPSKSKAEATQVEDVALPMPATRSSKRKASTAGRTAAAKKAKR